MGLGLGVSLAFAITQGMKNLFGIPRPHMLDRCDPDIGNIKNYVVGNFAQTFNQEWVLVHYGICRQNDKNFLDDGFKSFPSGHASCELTQRR